MSERDWDDLDERLDRAIDALNEERAPDQSADDDPQLAELLDTARFVRRLRAPADPDADFPDRLAAAVAAQAAGGTGAAIVPNGRVAVALRPNELSRRRRVRLLLAQLAAALRVIGVCVLAGMIAGGVVGGLGGRAAMRVSGYFYEREHPGQIATTQSSGEVVGQLSLSGTLYLIYDTTVYYGLIGGLLFLLVAPWLPRAGRARGLAFAGVLIAIGGAAVITSDNSDFRRFGPPLLNIAMFVAIIVGYGLAVAALAERFGRVSGSDTARRGRRAGVFALRLATLGLGTLGALVLALFTVGLVVNAGVALAARDASSLPIIPISLCMVALALARLAVALPEGGLAARLGGQGRVRHLALLVLGLFVAVTLVQLLLSIVAILTGR